MNAQHFNATTELNKLRQHKAICRKQHYQHSRLNKYRVELVELYKAGASLRELTLWLRREKRILISHTTIARFLNKLPELHHAQLP